MHDAHGLILLESELADIVQIAQQLSPVPVACAANQDAHNEAAPVQPSSSLGKTETMDAGSGGVEGNDERRSGNE